MNNCNEININDLTAEITKSDNYILLLDKNVIAQIKSLNFKENSIVNCNDALMTSLSGQNIFGGLKKAKIVKIYTDEQYPVIILKELEKNEVNFDTSKIKELTNLKKWISENEFSYYKNEIKNTIFDEIKNGNNNLSQDDINFIDQNEIYGGMQLIRNKIYELFKTHITNFDNILFFDENNNERKFYNIHEHITNKKFPNQIIIKTFPENRTGKYFNTKVEIYNKLKSQTYNTKKDLDDTQNFIKNKEIGLKQYFDNLLLKLRQLIRIQKNLIGINYTSLDYDYNVFENSYKPFIKKWNETNSKIKNIEENSYDELCDKNSINGKYVYKNVEYNLIFVTDKNQKIIKENITDNKYWEKYFSYVNKMALLPNNYPIGFIIPNPSGIIKIPMPVYWKHQKVITTKEKILLFGTAICGVSVSPYLVELKITDDEKTGKIKVAIRPNKTITNDFDSRIPKNNSSVIKTKYGTKLDTNPTKTKKLPLERDCMPPYKNLKMSNGLFIKTANEFAMAGKKAFGFFEN